MENLVSESEFLASSSSFSMDDIHPSLFFTIPIPERVARGSYQVNEVVDRIELCVSLGPLRKSYLDRTQPVRDGGHTYEKGVGNLRAAVQMWLPSLHPTQEREKEVSSSALF